MSKETVRFVAVKTAQKPVQLKFKTKAGRTVSFKALKTVKRPVVIRFRAKKK
jgi:hypothetical protein